jgi:hypothetical protein
MITVLLWQRLGRQLSWSSTYMTTRTAMQAQYNLPPSSQPTMTRLCLSASDEWNRPSSLHYCFKDSSTVYGIIVLHGPGRGPWQFPSAIPKGLLTSTLCSNNCSNVQFGLACMVLLGILQHPSYSPYVLGGPSTKLVDTAVSSSDLGSSPA